MTDKERILLTIIRQLSSTETLVMDRPWNPKKYEGHVHFAPWLASNDNEIKPGMLVMCETGGIHDWTIGYTIEPLNDNFGGWLIREIGSQRTCRVSNERFTPIVGLRATDLLEGKEREFYHKVCRAFHKGDEYIYRFGGVDMLPNRRARIWIREAFGGLNHNSIPFSFEMNWTPKTSIKAILKAMIDTGYGTREFDHKPLC